MTSLEDLRATYRDAADGEVRAALALGPAAYAASAWQVIAAEAARRGLAPDDQTPPEPATTPASTAQAAKREFPEYLAFLVVAGGYFGLFTQCSFLYTWYTAIPIIHNPPSLGLWFSLRATLPYAIPGFCAVVAGAAFRDTYPRAALFLLVASVPVVIAFILTAVS